MRVVLCFMSAAKCISLLFFSKREARKKFILSIIQCLRCTSIIAICEYNFAKMLLKINRYVFLAVRCQMIAGPRELLELYNCVRRQLIAPWTEFTACKFFILAPITQQLPRSCCRRIQQHKHTPHTRVRA